MTPGKYCKIVAPKFGYLNYFSYIYCKRSMIYSGSRETQTKHYNHNELRESRYLS